MRAHWHSVVVIACLFPLALACQGPEERGTRELESRQAGPSGSVSPGEPGEPAGPSPSQGAAAPESGAPAAGTDVAFSPPPEDCADQAEVQRECWTERFPREVSGKSDVSCRFTLRCCGGVVQRWTRAYPQAAGPSGVVLNDSLPTEFSCRNAPAPLGLSDLDGDGEPNDHDANPLTPGSGGYPWK